MHVMRWAGLVAVMTVMTVVTVRGDLPDPKTGGPGGRPVSLLVLSGSPGMGEGSVDAGYEKQLTEAGYRLVQVSVLKRLSPDYLRQFGAVILSGLPENGAEYNVNGQDMVHISANLALLHAYVADGGGLLVEPLLPGFGEGFADTYNRFLERYGARLLPQQLRHDAETKGAYAAGAIRSRHPIAAGLKDILYPINVLRWDHAYSTTPFILDREWTVLASAKPGAGTHQALDNGQVGEQLTAQNTLFAVRRCQKGWVALSAIGSYYTLTHVFSKLEALGENHTGVIDGIPMYGEKDGRPSELASLLDRAYRFLGANSAKNGLGGSAVDVPAQDPPPSCQPVIDWHTASPPPSWQHRVTGVTVEDTSPGSHSHGLRGRTYYDEHPDPLVQGDLRYFKALVGARTALSSGSGSVAEFRAAALKAGYSAVMFTETFADMDRAKWDRLVQDCRTNSDDRLVCLPGVDIEDFQGGRYLVIGLNRYPDPTWLTEDGRKLKATRMLSLGWYGHLTSVHRAGRSALHPKMYKHYHGITVYTYDGKGKLVDDALHAYQWGVRSDSNPYPIVAHEVESPEQVAVAAASGFQQVLPAPTLAAAVSYFRFGLPHFFDCPVRYFISEGPTLDGWSIINKDIGKPEENRDHYRLGIGVSGDLPIVEATLYDGFEVAGRWYPNTNAFHAVVDGFHDRQREYLLIAADTKGRRVLSPGIRTVVRNWRCRCGDRQNWLGSSYIYTGWHLPVLGNYSLPIRNTREGGSRWLGEGGGNPCPIFDFPYFGNHVKVEDADLSTKYVDAAFNAIGGDAKPTYAVRPTDFTDGAVRLWNFVPRGEVVWPWHSFFSAAIMEVNVRLKRDVEPAEGQALWPVIADAMGTNSLLILPGQAPARLPARAAIDLPVGSYVGGIIPLTPGLRLAGRSIGFPAPSPDTLNVYEGKTWSARYLVLKNSSFHYGSLQNGYETDAQAARALREMGFDGAPPYALELAQGKLDRLAYVADCTAAQGGIAGVCRNGKSEALLSDVPLRIRGLNPRVAAALWRSDTNRLDYFGFYQDDGYVTLNADKTTEFYAGNVAQCDPALFVSVVIWNDREAWFRVNNPTRRDIATELATAPAIKGFKPLKQAIAVKAGSSLDVISR